MIGCSEADATCNVIFRGNPETPEASACPNFLLLRALEELVEILVSYNTRVRRQQCTRRPRSHQIGCACTQLYFLGLTISETLDWSHHIQKISNKISKIIGIMSKLKHYLPSIIMKTIYTSLIQSHFYYGILVWGFDNSRLFKLQKKAVRIICSCKYNAHTDPIFKKLCLLKIQDIFIIQCAKFFYKFSHNKLPYYFRTIFVYNSEVHNYNTRQRNMLRPPNFNLRFTGKCIRFHIPNLINNLPDIVTNKIQTLSLQGFANYLKNYLLSKYDSKCLIENCYICMRNGPGAALPTPPYMP